MTNKTSGTSYKRDDQPQQDVPTWNELMILQSARQAEEITRLRTALTLARENYEFLRKVAGKSLEFTDCRGWCTSDDTCPHNKLRAALAATAATQTSVKTNPANQDGEKPQK